MSKPTTISINAELNEVIRSLKTNDEFKHVAISRLANILICEALNERLKDETGINYLDIINRD